MGGKIIVELKVAKAIAPEYQAQIINYLKATGIEVGLLVNFGNPKLEFKRLVVFFFLHIIFGQKMGRKKFRKIRRFFRK